MKLLEQDDGLNEIYDLLHRLGITANYNGYFYTAYAVHLAVERPQRLLLVTKWLYADVADHYGTNWKAVERSLRTAITVAWETNPALLSELAGHPLREKPRPANFLAILAARFMHP